MYKLDLEKAEEPKIKLPTSAVSYKKKYNLKKKKKPSTSASLTKLKPLTVWITTKCGKFLKKWEYHTTLSSPEKSVCRTKATVRIGHGKMDWFKSGKGV